MRAASESANLTARETPRLEGEPVLSPSAATLRSSVGESPVTSAP